MTRDERITWFNHVLGTAEKLSPKHLREAQRRLCREDLFYLLVVACGRKDVNKDWLHARCQEVQENPDGYCDLWAREHYKSTIITFAKTIQDILINPDMTVGIFSHTRPIAKGFLRQIKHEFESNEYLQNLFPEILYKNPRSEALKWSEDDGLIVKRKTNPKEATIEAHGLVDGQPTSKHFSLLVYDDVVTQESVSSPGMIEKVADSFRLSLNLGAHGGKRRIIGTRYHFNDTYKTILDAPMAEARIHPATKDGKADGEPVFLSREALAQKRRDQGPYIFGCQMLQDPRADGTQGFDVEWLSYWPAHHIDNLNVYIICDPAGEKKKSSDYTVFMVIGVGGDGNYRVITMVRDRLSLTEKGNMLFALHKEYQPLVVGYEKYGMQSDIQHFKDKMARENYSFRILELGGSMPKNDRIRRLVPLFEQRRIFLPDTCIRTNYEGVSQDLTAIFRDDEYVAFPVSAHDDMLDCLARIQDPTLKLKEPMNTDSPKMRKRRRMLQSTTPNYSKLRRVVG